MWNGNSKTFPLSPSTENNLKVVLLKGQTRINYQNNIKFIEHTQANSKNSNGNSNNSSSNNNNSNNKNNKSTSNKCTDRIAIDMELLMQKKCIAQHTA